MARGFCMGKFAANSTFSHDHINSTATHQAWEPTEHKFSASAFNSILRHNCVAPAVEENNLTAETFYIPGAHVLLNNFRYEVASFKILSKADRTIQINWPLTRKEEVLGSDEEPEVSDAPGSSNDEPKTRKRSASVAEENEPPRKKSRWQDSMDRIRRMVEKTLAENPNVWSYEM